MTNYKQEQYLFKAAKKHFCCFLSIKWFLSIVYSWDPDRICLERSKRIHFSSPTWMSSTPLNVFTHLSWPPSKMSSRWRWGGRRRRKRRTRTLRRWGREAKVRETTLQSPVTWRRGALRKLTSSSSEDEVTSKLDLAPQKSLQYDWPISKLLGLITEIGFNNWLITEIGFNNWLVLIWKFVSVKKFNPIDWLLGYVSIIDLYWSN